MRTFFFNTIYAITCLSIIIINSCKKDNDEKSSIQIPTLTTGKIFDIMVSSAFSGGTLKYNGGDTISSYGVCWSLDSIPTIADDKTIQTENFQIGFLSSITGLMPNTIYYLRAYATNSAGIGYGDILKFTTLPESGIEFTDIDGNIYHTVTIGTQVWMAENLKVGHYRNGESIPNVPDNSQWHALTTGAYCNYENSSTNGSTYGKLYNYYAVGDSLGLCPNGWHVPSKDDWSTLISFLGANTAGNSLKETGTFHWETPNSGATNQSSFTALPGGVRSDIGQFYGLGSAGYWWTFTTRDDNSFAYYNRITVNDSIVESLYFKFTMGESVRCIRD